MKAGRPTKLTEELYKNAREYLDGIGEDVETKLPTIEGLAIHLDVSRESLYEWEKNERFSYILESLRRMQANKLIQMSILNKYNPTISKMMLTKHGYIESSKQDITVEQVIPILGGKTNVPVNDSND